MPTPGPRRPPDRRAPLRHDRDDERLSRHLRQNAATATSQKEYVMRVLVTGAAGFIGSTLCLRLLDRGDSVSGIDNLNDYYDVNLKEARLARLRRYPKFVFQKMDVADRQAMAQLFSGNRFDAVAHLAAQAGVRYSMVNPAAYIDA